MGGLTFTKVQGRVVPCPDDLEERETMIKIDIDVRGLEARTLLESKRLAYSTATAINRTMLEIQREERAELDRRFTIRKNDFMYRLIKIFTFAMVFKGTGPP